MNWLDIGKVVIVSADSRVCLPANGALVDVILRAVSARQLALQRGPDNAEGQEQSSETRKPTFGPQTEKGAYFDLYV